MEIAGFEARLRTVGLSDGERARAVRLWEVADLERYVDRDELLRAAAPAEPPYWALVWSGAEALARAVVGAAGLIGRRVLDLGAGLGLSGLAAGLAGAEVTFADLRPESLAFAAASARANGLVGWRTVLLDFTRDTLDRRFDLVLAADVVYDPLQHEALAAFLDRHVASDGAAWVTDRLYVATDAFFVRLRERGFRDAVEDLTVPEMGEAMRTRLHRLTRR
ncbi:MAG: methyltransferase domain-containing protein [bacterium]